MERIHQEGEGMNSDLLEFRNALVELGKKGFTLEAKEPEFVEFAGKQLKPGRYGRDKGYAKAFLIVASDGLVYYQNKNGQISKRLTEKAFLTHWETGMTTFLGEI
jgi:hypothetical protein